MVYSAEQILKLWFYILMFLCLTQISCSPDDGEKSIDIKIGFELADNSKEGPFIKVQDGSKSKEYKPRVDDVLDAFKQDPPKIEQDKKDSSDSSNENSDSGEGGQFTRGMRPEEYEPEEKNMKSGPVIISSEENNDDRRRRHKRSLNQRAREYVKNLYSRMKRRLKNLKDKAKNLF